MKLLMDWWINNSWRFWQYRWAWSKEPYEGVAIWEEYRHKISLEEPRSLVDLILEEYSQDIDRAYRNPIVFLICKLRRFI